MNRYTPSIKDWVECNLVDIADLLLAGAPTDIIAGHYNKDKAELDELARKEPWFGDMWFNENKALWPEYKEKAIAYCKKVTENLARNWYIKKTKKKYGDILGELYLNLEHKVDGILDMSRNGIDILDIAKKYNTSVHDLCTLAEKWPNLKEALKLSKSYVKLKTYKALVDDAIGGVEVTEINEQVYKGQVWQLKKTYTTKPNIQALKFLMCNEWPDEFKLLDKREVSTVGSITFIDDIKDVDVAK